MEALWGEILTVLLGYPNVAIGSNALQYTQGGGNVAVGFECMQNGNSTNASNNTGLGFRCAQNIGGSRNVCLGANICALLSIGSNNNVCLGDGIGMGSGFSNNVLIGTAVKYNTVLIVLELEILVVIHHTVGLFI